MIELYNSDLIRTRYRFQQGKLITIGCRTTYIEMTDVPFTLYHAFSDTALGGSPVGVIVDATSFSEGDKKYIAGKIGAPATCFVLASDSKSITAQFYSTVMELPMCGHGTIGLMTRMVELGIFDWDGGDFFDVKLHLPSKAAVVELCRRKDDRLIVMLDIDRPAFDENFFDHGELAKLLGISINDFHRGRPVETAVADFIHLIVPMKGLDAIRRINPDYARLKLFCLDRGIETVATFCNEVEQPDRTLHVRDFCPAVGVAESAAAGTTNGALAGYLIRHNLAKVNGDGKFFIQSEQGIEINLPSSISSIATVNAGIIERLQVGGVATKIKDSQLHLLPRAKQ